MWDIPNLGCPVILIECVLRINEEKTPVFFLRVLLPEDAHVMYAALYPQFHSPGQLVYPTGGLCCLPCHPKHALRHQPSPGFSHVDRSDPWLLVQCDQPADHHCAIGVPWGQPIAHLFCEVANNQPQFPTCCPETK